jgi:endonuclease G
MFTNNSLFKNIKTNKINNRLFFIVSLSLLILPGYFIWPEIPQTASDKWKVHVELGIPTDSDPSDDYLIKRDQYVLSYNKNKNVANWASWNLNKTWYGKYNRVSGFKADNSLPEGFYRVKTQDYTNSGYDRGHIVASIERSKTVTANKFTFLMSNIYPQEPDLNQGPWKKLEEYCRSLCTEDYKELYIMAGGVFRTGQKLNDLISIPDSCYKIIVILRRDQGLGALDASTQVIAVMMPNKVGIKKKAWDSYRTTIDRIEQSTGYDFLSDVPESIQRVLENKQ